MAKKLNPIDPALEIRILKESVLELKAEIKNISNYGAIPALIHEIDACKLFLCFELGQ